MTAGLEQTTVRAANRLTAGWAGRLDGGASTVLSGAGAWPLLALLAAAADGPARAELAAAAGVPADGADAAARALLASLAATGGVRGAFGVWTGAELAIDPWWTEHAPPGVRGTLTGDPAADQRTLDAWAARHTNGLIPAMPVAAAEDTAVVLATALSAVTAWRQPFTDTPMRVPRGPWAGRGEIAGLTRTGPDLDAVAVVGPVTILTVAGTEDLDVHLVMGEPGAPPGAVLGAALRGDGARRGGADLLAAGGGGPGLRVTETASFDPRPRLAAATTRFTVTAEHDLLAHAELFGLTAASRDDRVHFPRLSAAQLVVTQAKQAATATFSATGFEAAAVTAAGMVLTSAPTGTAPTLAVTFDRPFGFVATDRASGLALFAGWVAEPERRA